ncbi:MAG: riboflavin synthase [Thermoleophilia bacterium]
MFTGLVEEVGTVVRLVHRAEGAHLFVRARRVLPGTRLGDSLAVNGACLTVVELGSDLFAVDCMSETLEHTTIGELRPGDEVNLERALALGGRLGGHLVLGHVDGVGRVLSVRAQGLAQEIRIAPPPALRPFLADKGSVAVDGISLTITDVDEADFGLGIIPHTLAQTTLRRVTPGRRVNLEVDVLARYVHRALGVALRGVSASAGVEAGGLTEQTLRSAGFLD